MSSLGEGQTITLYLKDGSADGIWKASLANWNGVAYKIPRECLKLRKDLSDRGELEHLKTPGVYFLFGKDDEDEKPFIYVGETEDVQERLGQPHKFEQGGKSYWTEAVIFVTPGPEGTLDKGRVKYLENKFFTMATEAKRYIVKNGNTPTQSLMREHIKDSLEKFIINAKLILPTLGYKAFEPLPGKGDADDDKLLYFERNHGKGGRATGRIASDGFWVLKDSYIYPQVADYAPSGIKKARENHAARIKNGILQEDICFGSPSFASTFVCGKNSNGLDEWKDKNGISLKLLDSGKPASDKKKDIAKPWPTGGSADAEMLYLKGKKAAASGRISGDGFIVKKGSGFSPSETKSCQAWIKSLRAQLIADGKVKDCVFAEDVYFKSPSAAAACVIGGSASGNIMWLYSDGQSIRDKAEN